MKHLPIAAALLLSFPPLYAQQPRPDTARMGQIVSSYYNHKQFMGSILVVRGDRVLFEKSYGYANLEWNTPFAADARFRIGSLTKQFTAASIMLLQERGKLKTSDPISLYLPNTPAAWSKITIRNLLTHTSGIPSFTHLPEYETRVRLLPTTPEKEYLSVRDKPLEFQPGEKFSYSNSNYILLGMIVEKASGMKYAAFLQQNLFQPLHMINTGMDSNERILHHRVYGYAMTGKSIVNAPYADMTVPFAAGGLYSTTHDLAAWNKALFGGKILKPKSLTEMTTPYKSDNAYGLVVRTVDGHKQIEHFGDVEGFAAFLSYDIADRLTVVVLGNINSGAAGAIGEDFVALAHGKRVALVSEMKPVRILPKILAQYAGVYALNPKLSITVTVSGDHLEAQGTQQPKLAFYAASKSRFFSAEIDAEIEFFRNRKGIVDHLVLYQGGQEIQAGKK